MRQLLIVGLLAMVGCATAPNPSSVPGSIEWDTVLAHSVGAPEPAVKDGQLVLSGRAMCSRATYTPSFTLECEVQSTLSSNASFYIDFVPQDASAAVLPQRYVSIKLNNNSALEVWASTSNQSPRLIKSTVAQASAEGRYKLVIEVQRDGFTVDGTKVDLPIPYDRFHVELRTFPPPSQWLVRNFTIQ